MTNRTRVMMLVLFLASFAAGVGAAWVFPPMHQGPGQRGGGPGWLSGELKLSKDQQEAMAKIWDKQPRPNWEEDREQRNQISKQRDDAIRQMIPVDKQADFDAVNESAKKQMAEIGTKQRKAFEDAVKATKALLTPEQLKKYEEIMSRRSEGRRGGGPGGPGGPGEPGGPGRGPDHGPDHEHHRPGGAPAPTTGPAPEKGASPI